MLGLAARMPISRGAFIVFEGIDRCGKTTQCTKLINFLQQHDVRASASPGTHRSSFSTCNARGLTEGDFFPLQVKAEMWRYPDRTTKLGEIINAFLSKKITLPDKVAHMLFAANRWEKR